MIDQLCLQKEVLSGQKKIADVILRTPYSHSVADAERTQHVQYFGISSVFF